MFETQCFWMSEYRCPLYCPTTQCPTLNVTIYSLTIASVIVTFILREYLNQKHYSIRLPVTISRKNRMIYFLQNSIACFVHKTNDAPGTVLWQISKWRPRLHAFLQTKWIFQLYIILTLWNMRLRQGSLDLVITRSSDKFGVSVYSDLTLSFMHISHKTWITFKIYFHE